MSDSSLRRMIKEQWVEEAKMNGGHVMCYACHLPILHAREITYDHWYPKSLGGRTTYENGRPMHSRCNSVKSNMLPEEWEAKKWQILHRHGIKTIMDYDISGSQIDLNNLPKVTQQGNTIIQEYNPGFKPLKIKKSKVKTRSRKKKGNNIPFRKLKDSRQQHAKRMREIKREEKKQLFANHSTQVGLKGGPFHLSRPYDIGSIINYIVEKRKDIPVFEIKEGIVIGITFRDSVRYALVKDFYLENGKVMTQLLEVLPMSLKQAELVKSHQEFQVQQMLSRKVNQYQH